MRRRMMLGAVLAMKFAATSVGLAASDDPSVLRIEGPGGEVLSQYPVDQLRSEFENMVIETRTPWTSDSPQTSFRGPLIADVLRRHGLDAGGSVQFLAYDNFVSEVLLEEIEAYDPIFAIDRACRDEDREDGRCTDDQEFTPLTTEEQGPIFLVWPYDRLPGSYVPARNSIWVWFVVAVRPVK